ncbi:hypothetical protein Dip518_000411 [Parelusimicrobium proximum]
MNIESFMKINKNVILTAILMSVFCMQAVLVQASVPALISRGAGGTLKITLYPASVAVAGKLAVESDAFIDIALALKRGETVVIENGIAATEKGNVLARNINGSYIQELQHRLHAAYKDVKPDDGAALKNIAKRDEKKRRILSEEDGFLSERIVPRVKIDMNLPSVGGLPEEYYDKVLSLLTIMGEEDLGVYTAALYNHAKEHGLELHYERHILNKFVDDLIYYSADILVVLYEGDGKFDNRRFLKNFTIDFERASERAAMITARYYANGNLNEDFFTTWRLHQKNFIKKIADKQTADLVREYLWLTDIESQYKGLKYLSENQEYELVPYSFIPGEEYISGMGIGVSVKRMSQKDIAALYNASEEKRIEIANRKEEIKNILKDGIRNK